MAASPAPRWGRISFRNGRRQRLAALFGVPGGPRPPVVVFAHDWNGSKADPHVLAVAQRLWEVGIATLLPDLAGHGESEGVPLDTNPAEWADDLGAVIVQLQGRDEIDERRIGLGGLGLGGTAALVAAASGLALRALAVQAPPMEGYTRLVAGVQVPTLIVQGDADPLLWSSRVLADTLGAWGHLDLIPGARHQITQPAHLEELVRLIAAWFRRYLAQ